MTDRGTLTLLADGGILIGFPPGTDGGLAQHIREQIERYVARDHTDGVGLSIPIPMDVDDQRFALAQVEPQDKNPENAELPPADPLLMGIA